MTEWDADEKGYVTNGPGTIKRGDRIRLTGYKGGDRLLEVTDTPVDEGGHVTIEVRQVGP